MVRILSPMLFSLYVNHLTEKLISYHAGCHFNGISINHVIHADGLCLLALPASAMHCIAHFYGIVIGSIRLIKFVLHTTMCIEKKLIFLRRAALVRCMSDIIFAVLKNFINRLEVQ